jgi:hypothetical protein
MMQTIWRLPRIVLQAFVKAYRLLLSPWVGNQCRFEPTCSFMLCRPSKRRAPCSVQLSHWGACCVASLGARVVTTRYLISADACKQPVNNYSQG